MSNDPRVARILGEWQRARDAGSAPEPAVVITEHPELAEQLRAGFAMITALDEVYAHERGAAQTFPSRIGPYALVCEIGTGGMGTVYEATVAQQVSGLEIGDRVALKVVHPHLLARAGFFKRFLREAEAGRRVRHSKVVSTLDADARETDGRTHLYLVMEYVEGRTLRELLEDLGVVPEALVREIAAQLADGLAGIHETGVVHRDLKPDNVIITPDDQIRIMDMGVARLDDDHGTLTEHGQFAGSLHYAAPEQFDAREVGPATDLYALGVLLYELATGDNPFRRDDVGSTIRAHLEEVPPRADDRETTVSRYVAEVLHTLLAKDPGSRFASASELAEVLNEAERSPWWAAREQAALKAHAHFPRVPVRRETALHGREDELALLAAAWDSAKQGEGRSVLFEGEAGIGKSRLIDAFLKDLPDEDVHVLYGSYPPGGGEGAITDAIREHFGTAELADALRPYLVESSALVEPLAALLRHERAPSGSPLLGGNALQTALSRLMQGLAAEKPLIWIVEDLHFASLESRNVVLSLARALQSRCVLLIMTTRPGLPEELRTHFGRIETHRRTTLSRLGARDVILLLEAAFHSQKLAEKLGARIAKASDGVPFFVFEMIRGLREGQLVTQLPDGSWGATSEIDRIEVPPAVRELVEARLRDLSSDERALLDVGAVIGFQFDPDLVARVLERPRLRVLQDLAGIERTLGVVRAEGLHCRFDHHQIQEVLYEDLSEALREEYHTLLADRRAAAESEVPTGEAARFIAYHHLAGRTPVAALPMLEPALAWLDAEGRNEEFLALGQRALSVDGLLSGERRFTLLCILARSNGPIVRSGRWAEAEELSREVEKLAENLDDDRSLLLASQFRGARLLRAERPHEAIDVLRDSLERVRRLGDEAGSLELMSNLALAHLAAGQTEVAMDLWEQVLSNPRIEDHPNSGAMADAGRGIAAVRLERGDYDRAEMQARQTLTLAQRHGFRTNEVTLMLMIGQIFRRRGAVEEAMCWSRQGLEASRQIGARECEHAALFGLGQLDTDRGEYETARRSYLAALDIALELGSLGAETGIQSGLCAVANCQGRLAEGQEHSKRVLEIATQLANRPQQAVGHVNLGASYRRLGDSHRAREHVEQALELCQAAEFPYPKSYCEDALGRLAMDEGDWIRAAEHFQEAVALAAEFSRTHLPEVTLSLAECRWRGGEEASALKHLREGLDLAEQTEDAFLKAYGYALCSWMAGGEVEPALRAAAGGPPGVARRVHLILWEATQSPVHLSDAKADLEALLAQNSAECHAGICTNVFENRAILDAWRSEFGEDGAPGDAPTG